MTTASRRAALGLLCASVAACGGSAHKQPTAASVCAAGRAAALPLLGPSTAVRIADRDPVNIECLLDGRGVHVDVVAQTSPRAWTAYDTVTSHLAQVFGPTSVHNSADLPLPVPSVGGNAVWVAGQGELVATSGTPTASGTYITVTVKRASPRAPSGLSVAAVVARATLKVAPRGSSPGS